MWQRNRTHSSDTSYLAKREQATVGSKGGRSSIWKLLGYSSLIEFIYWWLSWFFFNECNKKNLSWHFLLLCQMLLQEYANVPITNLWQRTLYKMHCLKYFDLIQYECWCYLLSDFDIWAINVDYSKIWGFLHVNYRPQIHFQVMLCEWAYWLHCDPPKDLSSQLFLRPLSRIMHFPRSNN